jgi:hypothetical protein
MSDCLWNDIDAYLEAAVKTAMGAASAYTTLKVQTVELDDTFEPKESWLLPAFVISSFRAEVPDQTFQMSFGNYSDLYRVGLTAVTLATTRRQARIDAKTLNGRTMKLTDDYDQLGGLTASDGEHVVFTNVTAREVRVYPVADDRWMGVSIVAFDVVSDQA